MLGTDVEVGERRLRLVPAGRLRGRGGGQRVALLRQDAVAGVASRDRAQAAVAQQQVEAARAEVSQPPRQVSRLHELPRVLEGRRRGAQR